MRPPAGGLRLLGATKPAVQEPSRPRVNSNFSPAHRYALLSIQPKGLSTPAVYAPRKTTRGQPDRPECSIAGMLRLS